MSQTITTIQPISENFNNTMSIRVRSIQMCTDFRGIAKKIRLIKKLDICIGNIRD